MVCPDWMVDGVWPLPQDLVQVNSTAPLPHCFCNRYKPQGKRHGESETDVLKRDLEGLPDESYTVHPEAFGAVCLLPPAPFYRLRPCPSYSMWCCSAA